MASGWESEFRERLLSFEEGREPGAVSIKVRVTAGCFHRDHSPQAYGLIDKRLRELDGTEFSLVEHENGPEILTAIGVAANVIQLVVTIFLARRNGVKQGDCPAEPLELIVRRFDDAGRLREETVLRARVEDEVSEAAVDRAIRSALTAPAAKRRR